MIKDGQVLIAKRRSPDPFQNKWEFPGGKIEPGESPEACLARELQEELGITVKVRDFFCSSTYEYKTGAIELLAYRVEWESGQMEAKEHEEIRWVSMTELSYYDFLPADVPIVERLSKKI